MLVAYMLNKTDISAPYPHPSIYSMQRNGNILFLSPPPKKKKKKSGGGSEERQRIKRGIDRNKELLRLLKALFNNVFTLKISKLHGPTCNQCMWLGVKMKPWKIFYFKSIIKCFKRVKIDKWPDSPYPFPPIDYCVRINGEPPFIQWWYSVIDFLIVTASISKLLHSWLFIDSSENHYATQTSKFNNLLNRSSTGILWSKYYNINKAKLTNVMKKTRRTAWHTFHTWLR